MAANNLAIALGGPLGSSDTATMPTQGELSLSRIRVQIIGSRKNAPL